MEHASTASSTLAQRISWSCLNPSDRHACAARVAQVLNGSTNVLDLRGITLHEWPSSLLELPASTEFRLPIPQTEHFDQIAGRECTIAALAESMRSEAPDSRCTHEVRTRLQEEKRRRLAELGAGPLADAAAQTALVQEMAEAKRHVSDGQLIESQVRNVLSGDSCCLTLYSSEGHSYLADDASLPQALQHLMVLRVLYLSEAKRLKLPPLAQLSSLEYLAMQHSGLLEIPSWMGQLAALKVLHLDRNPQARLPTSPGPFRQLTILELTNAGITEMPLWLEELPVLKELYLSHNRLARLPEPRGLRRLHVLELNGCGLSRLPDWVVELPSLTKLSLRGNPWQMPPASIANGELDQLRRYMADARRFGLRQSSQAKLVLVGSGLAGKTSLLRGLCSGAPTMTDAADRTLQLDISALSLTAADAQAEASLTCWDFGGQPEYAAAQQAYLKGDGVYVLVVPAHLAQDDHQEVVRGELVVTPRDDVNTHRDELVGRWLNALQANTPGAEVQLVLSQIDRVAAEGSVLEELLRGQMVQEVLSNLPQFPKRTDAYQQDSFRNDLRALQERLASKDLLASQIAWLRARVAEHQERQAVVGSKKLNIQPDILLASSFSKQGVDVVKDWRTARQTEAFTKHDARGFEHDARGFEHHARDTIYGAISQLSLITCFQKLKDLGAKCPSMKFMIPNSYVPAMAFLRALRDGRNPLHAALVQSVAPPLDRQRRPYIERSALREMWRSDIVPAFEQSSSLARSPEALDALDSSALVDGSRVLVVKFYPKEQGETFPGQDLSSTGFLAGTVLGPSYQANNGGLYSDIPSQQVFDVQLDTPRDVDRSEMGMIPATVNVVSVRPEDAKVGLQLPELRRFEFTDALKLMCQQGEMFAAGGLVFLDPEFITELIKPLVDHRLDHAEHASRVQDEMRAYIKGTPELASDKRALERLQAALRSFLKEGRLDIELVNFLWRWIDLDCEHRLHALAMLVETGMMVEVAEASTASSSSSNHTVAQEWIMPMKLPVERPAMISKRWPEQLGQAEEELQVSYDLYGYMPPDVPHRLVSACYALGNVAACWRQGALIIAAGRSKKLVFVREDKIIVCARGSATPDVWQAAASAMQQVEHILGDIPGIQCRCSLACPKCLKKSPDAAFQFEGFSIEAALGLDPWCEKCEEDVITLQRLEPIDLEPIAKRQRLATAAATGELTSAAAAGLLQQALEHERQQINHVAAQSTLQQQQLGQVIDAGAALATQVARTEQRVDGIECAGAALATQAVAHHVALQNVAQAGAVLADQAQAQGRQTRQTVQQLHEAEARLDRMDHDVQASARQGQVQARHAAQAEQRLQDAEAQLNAHDLALGLHDPALVNKVKRASVRIGIYERATKKLVSLGSGTIIDAGPAAPLGQVLSAAHLFIHANVPALPPRYTDPIDWMSMTAPFIILIGMYQADDRPSRWEFWAELITPLSVLQTTNPHSGLVDLAVLRIRGKLEMSPAVFSGPRLSETFQVVSRSGAAPSLSLPDGIELGNPLAVQTGISTVTVFGWFAPNDEDTLYMPQRKKIISNAHGLLISQALLHTAGSGGAQVDPQGRLLAVNSRSRDPAIPMPKDYKAYGRMVSDLLPAHGLIIT